MPRFEIFLWKQIIVVVVNIGSFSCVQFFFSLTRAEGANLLVWNTVTVFQSAVMVHYSNFKFIVPLFLVSPSRLYGNQRKNRIEC